MTSTHWPQTTAQARAVQEQLRSRVCLRSQLCGGDISLVAGVDVAFPDKGRTTRAALVVLSFPEMQPQECHVVELPTCFPYVPGYLSFRELPALLKAWRRLQCRPQLVLCDGQGIAHPRRFGLACHLGVELGIPTIGVAKNRLSGSAAEPGWQKLSKTPLMDGNDQLGWIFRSRNGVKPLYISPGHLVSLTDCWQWLEVCCLKYRLPEPTRLADKLSKHGSYQSL